MIRALRPWLAGAVALVAAAPAVAGDGPAALLAQVYAAYAATCEGPEFIGDPAAARRLFSADTVALFARAWRSEEATPPGFDVFLAAQDCQITAPPRVTVEDTADGHARATVAFTNLGEPTVVVHDLVLGRAGWRIHDIHWTVPEPLSLRRALSEAVP